MILARAGVSVSSNSVAPARDHGPIEENMSFSFCSCPARWREAFCPFTNPGRKNHGPAKPPKFRAQRRPGPCRLLEWPWKVSAPRAGRLPNRRDLYPKARSGLPSMATGTTHRARTRPRKVPAPISGLPPSRRDLYPKGRSGPPSMVTGTPLRALTRPRKVPAPIASRPPNRRFLYPRAKSILHNVCAALLMEDEVPNFSYI